MGTDTMGIEWDGERTIPVVMDGDKDNLMSPCTSLIHNAQRMTINNPAVADRPRDAVSVSSFSSTIHRAQSSVINYFRFRFTAAAAYKLCSLRFVVIVHAVGCDEQRFTYESPSTR